MTMKALFAAALAAAIVPVAAAAAPEPLRGIIIFLAADRNSDGAVDRSESDEFRALIFDGIDTNKDARLTPQEVGVLIVPGKENADPKEQEKIAKRREELLAKLDLAKPEGVSRDEYLDHSGEIFAKADADKDGKVSPAEFVVILDTYGVLLPR